MTIAEQMIPELKAEGEMTRKLLSRIPQEKLGFSPGKGVQTIGWNAVHLAEIAGWVPAIVEKPGLDIGVNDPSLPPPPAMEVGAILKRFDENLAKSLAALQGVSDAVMAEPWKMAYAGQHLFTMPKGECVRKWVFAHTAHHRGILSVELRLAGVEHTSIYEG